MIGETLGTLAETCRSRNLPVLCILIPRAGGADDPEERGPGVARYTELAARHGLTMLDLTPAFDHEDPADVALAPWDDHPNALGHQRLFQTFATRIVKDPSLSHSFFDASESETPIPDSRCRIPDSR